MSINKELNTYIPNTYTPPNINKPKSTHIPTHTPTPSYLNSPTCSNMFMYDDIPKCSHTVCNSQIEINSTQTLITPIQQPLPTPKPTPIPTPIPKLISISTDTFCKFYVS